MTDQWLVRKLLEQDKKIEALSRGGTGVGHTSIAPGEALTVISEDGEVVLGAGGVDYVDGPTPATPSAPTLKLGFGTIEVTWDGSFAEGEDENGIPITAPIDLALVEIHASTDPAEEEWGGDTLKAQVKTKDGFTVTIGGFDVDDEVHVCLIAVSEVPKRSAPSATASLVVEGLDFSQLFNELDAANATIKNAGEILVTEQGTLDEKLTEVDGTLDNLGQDLEAVEAAQEALSGDLTDVMTSIDGKNTIKWDPAAPTSATPGKATGDMWYRTSGNSIIGFWKWDGSDWVTQLLDKTTIPLIDIGAGTFGSMSGGRLSAHSITSDRVIIGSGGNVVPWGQITAGSTYSPHEPYGPTGSTASLTPANSSKGLPAHLTVARTSSGSWASIMSFWAAPGQKLPVDEGTEYVFTVRVYSANVSQARVSLFAYNHGGSSTANNSGVFASSSGTALSENVSEITVRGRVPAGVGYCLPYLQSSAAGAVGVVSVDLRKAVGTTLIEDGAVSTQKLTADVLEVKNLKATTGQLNEAVITKLWAEAVVAKMVTATEFIGENAILTGAVTAPKITASEELWAKIGEFVKIRAEQIEADAIDGMVITGPNIRTAASGARVQLDAGGLSVYDSLDDWQVRLTPDGSSFKGDLEAESLVANGAAEFKSTDNILARGAKLTLAAGVTDPTAPPIVQPYWDGIEFTPTEGKTYYGLAFAGGKYWTFEDAPKSSGGDRLVSIDPSTGVVGDAITMTDNFWAAGGVTAIGSELFLLGPKSGTDYKYFVRVYSTAGALLREWEYADIGWSKTNQLVYKPGIGSNGTNVVIAQCDDLGSLRWRTYNKSTGALLSEVNANDATKSDISGIYIGAADHGGGTFATIAKTATKALPSFTTSGVYAPERSWRMADDASEIGVVFADGKFRTLNASGVIREYADGGTGDGSGDWWCAYRWETDTDSDGTIDYRSKIGPPARFTWPRRARLKATGQPKPVGVELMAGFLAKKATKPSRTDFKRNYTSYSLTRSIAYWDWYQNTGDAPADGNNYPTATPSSIASASSTFEVKGDGSGKWGPLTFNADGTMSSSAVPAWIPITAFASGFSVASFGYAPAYRVWPDGKVEWRGVVSGNITGFSSDVLTIPVAARPPFSSQGYAATQAGDGSFVALTRLEFGPEAAPTKLRVYRGGTNRSWFSLDNNSYYKS